MAFWAQSGEVGPPPRRPGLLQGGGYEPSHNPRGHILGPRLYPPRLGLLGHGRREPDEVRGWVLRGEESDLDSFGADDQSFLEGGYGGAGLQRKQIPPPYPSRHPIFFRSYCETLYNPVVVAPALTVSQGDPLSPIQLV